jgi:hypothetical protein
VRAQVAYREHHLFVTVSSSWDRAHRASHRR